MGELFGDFNNTPEAQIARDKQVEMPDNQMDVPGMEGLKCDGLNPVDGAPIFNVDHGSFYQNTSNGRQRLRFQAGSDVQKFMQNGRYRQSFYLRHDKNGYIRKVK